MITRVVLALLLWSAFAAQAAVFFPTGSTWRFLRGTNEASFPDTLAWTGATNNFDDSRFVDAPAPFWYGDVREGGTQLLDMQNRYTCIFLRKGFMVTNAAQFNVLRLNYFVDDGLVVWINGHEVWRENVPAGPVSTNTLAANQPTDPAVYTNVLVTPASGILLDGSNTIAVQVFNTSPGSSDLGFDLSLEAFVPELVPPTIAGVSPAPGSVVTSLNSITVTFSEPVVGVTADDFLIDTQPANAVTGSGTTYTFTFGTPPYGGVFITWFPDPGIYDLAVPPNPFDAAASSWFYQLNDETPPVVATLFPSDGSTVRTLTQVEVTFSEEVNGVDASDLRVNGQPALSVSRAPGGPYVFQVPPVSAGPVHLEWAANHGIADQADPANPFAGGSWNYLIDPNVTVGNLFITEILASNQDGITDEDGEPQDWIEIQNRGVTAVNLGGWSLSDDPELPGLWVFPSTVLGPGQYLVVFASGKDRKAPATGNRLHTNFKLGIKEFLGLYNGDSPRALVSGFTEYPEQRNDFSYGYDPQGVLRYFATPTPGAANGASTINGVAAPVHFSAPRGFFTQPFTLNLTCPTPGAQIRYTTNGSDPTILNGFAYLGPLPIAGTTVLRAAAFRSNLLSSTIATHTYFFNQSAAVRSLPVISIVTATSNLFGRSGILGMGGGSRAADGLFITNNPATDYHNPSGHGIAWERPVSVEYIKPEDNSGFQIDCGIRVQGSDWQRPRTLPTSKFSLRLYFRGDYGSSRLDYPLFPHTTVQSFDQVVLRAGYNEPNNPFIRDEMGRRTFGDMGNVTSQGGLAHVFTNGFYAGLYNPCERVHEEFGQSHHGGSSDWDIVGPDFAQSSEGPGVIDGDRNDFNNLHNYINGQSAASIATPAVYNEIARRLDLANFVDYCLVNVFSAMGDWPANNWRAGKDRGPGGIWRFYVWDAEWGLGFGGRGFTRDTFAESGPGPSDSGLASTANSEIARMYQSLRRNPEFRLLWADRIYKHFFNGGALTELAETNRLIELRDQLNPIFAMNMTELGPFLSNRRANIFDDFQFYGLFGYSNALYGVFASSNAPAFNQHGGPVPPGFSLTMAAPLGGTIYYTTDGSDPRVPFTGAVSNAATAYAGPITLLQSGLIRARTLRNTNWSALAEAAFAVGTLGVPVRITEIMYNPTGGSLYEFIELQNIGGTPVDLGGMYFSEGIDFTFTAGSGLAPGARLVLANGTDPNAFAARYPGVTPRGYFSGNLNNAGERLTLRDGAGRIVVSVSFRDNNGWPPLADGAGYSLELIDPLGNPDDPANWRASSALNGSPGTAGAIPPPGAIRLNEVLALNIAAVANGPTHPDFVELANPSAAPVNLTGWSLSDDGAPGEFPIPAGTIIPAGGFLVIWCDSVTNTTPGLHAGFELDPDGDGLFLFDAASNRVDAVTFGVQAADYSLGRIAGAWTVNIPTPGAMNTAAATGSAADLVLNEWMANPPPGQSDWIELYNTSATLPVPLRGIYVGTTGAVHRIASLSVLRPGGFLQLFADEGVGTDHLSFRLPAAGGAIVLQDTSAQQVQRVDYGAQAEGVSQGRLPDGAAGIVSFPGTASPEAPNYAATYTGPVLNEVLARNVKAVTNAGRVADYVELANPAAAPASLAGLSLSVGGIEPGQWVFPASAVLPANGYLVVWCDSGRPASTNAGSYNTGRSLDGESDGVYLFNAAGQIVNFVEFGPQVQDLSIGLSGGQWRLLAAPTPGSANATVATTGNPGVLRLNEWMANPAAGPDWLEVYNPTNLPIDLAGLRLTDDFSLTGTNEFIIPALSFAGARGFVRWIADGNPGQGRDHASFSLDAQGEGLKLINASGLTTIDTIVFGAQALGISEGRLPDGTGAVTRFSGTASPAAANYVLIPDLVINEVLTHTDPPLEDAVELLNSGPAPLNVGGWFLSNAQADFSKYRIPDGATIPAHGFLVLYEGQFNAGPGAFTLNAAHGDEIWLSAADALGNLTGARITARVGAALNGVSFGRVVTSTGTDYAALGARTFGQDTPASVTQFRTGTGLPNAAPQVGPILINEIHYNPPPGPGEADEYIELYNNSGAAVALFHGAVPTNTWKLEGGIAFTFPADISIPAGGYALVVGFNPADAAALAGFQARQGVPPGVPVFGPFQGKLDNSGDTVELVRPDSPQPAGAPDVGFVPYVVADRVAYGDSAPWPAGAVDGGGLSLQRKTATLYGNEPLNWVGANPTPGAANGNPPVSPPVVITQPASQTVFEGATPDLAVAAAGSGPLRYQWRLNGTAIPHATNNIYALDFALTEDTGLYDVIVSNPGGSALSQSAALRVVVPPVVLVAPTNLAIRPAQTARFAVVARGDAPLAYQWRRNGSPLSDETNSILVRTNIQLPDEGTYEVVISNEVGTNAVSALLQVLINPVLTLNPISQVVPVGGQVTLSAAWTGNPPPFNVEWRKTFPAPTTTNAVLTEKGMDVYTFTAPSVPVTYQYRLVIRNLANTAGIGSPVFTVTTVPDSDGDGIPDAWEQLYGFAPDNAADRDLDPDGDGVSNWREYLAGTDPTNALSYLRVDLTTTPGAATVQFNATSNKTYSVQFNDALGGPWSHLADILARTNSRLESILDPTWSTNRFYRLISPAQPAGDR